MHGWVSPRHSTHTYVESSADMRRTAVITGDTCTHCIMEYTVQHLFMNNFYLEVQCTSIFYLKRLQDNALDQNWVL